MSLLVVSQTMWLKVIFGTFAVLFQFGTVSTQRQWVPPTTTAAEMWNPYTWYWPYAIAASEGYREYFQNAQQITNQLYMQAYATNAFWWTNRPNNGNGGTGQAGQAAGGAAGQAGQAAGGAAGQAGQAAGGAAGQAGQAGQAAGGAAGQAGQAAGGATGQAGQATGGQGGQGMGGTGNQPVANMAQGGTGWGK